MDLFVDFLVTKDGLAGALHNDSAGSDKFHAYFVDRLVPVCDALLNEATRDRESGVRINAYALMRGRGNLCIGAGNDPLYDVRLVTRLLINGVFAE